MTEGFREKKKHTRASAVTRQKQKDAPQAATKRFRDGATAGGSNSKMRPERLKMHTVRDQEIKRLGNNNNLESFFPALMFHGRDNGRERGRQGKNERVETKEVRGDRWISCCDCPSLDVALNSGPALASHSPGWAP